MAPEGHYNGGEQLRKVYLEQQHQQRARNSAGLVSVNSNIVHDHFSG